MQIEIVLLSELKEDPKNARKHNEKNLKAIKGSLETFGQQKPIVIDTNKNIIAGNGTYRALKELGREYAECVITTLNKEQIKAYALADNRSAELAEWDDDNLSDLLNELNNDGFNLDDIGFDKIFVKGHMRDLENAGDESIEKYSTKILAPIYEPKGPKPELRELFDDVKTIQLVKEIEESNISTDEKVFLKHAATRHIVFNYENIAEYYAHSSIDIQTLMEKSALVIIDFNKAIENGFIRMSKDIAETFQEDENEE